MSSATSIYIVYETTNLINGKYYIGVHKQDGSNYLGSGKRLKLALFKYGQENFIRETLREFDNEQDAYDFERLIVDEILVDNTNCYNMCLGGHGGSKGSGENNPFYGRNHSEETKRKISSTQRKNNHWRGKQHTKESIQKMKEAQLGVKHHMYGKRLSKEMKEKIKESTSTHTYHINGNTFRSSREAGRYFDVAPNTILRWCKSPNKPNCHRVFKSA